jgi:hypothetical protein
VWGSGREATYFLNLDTSHSVVCLTNQALRHEGVWGSGCVDPRKYTLYRKYLKIKEMKSHFFVPCDFCLMESMYIIGLTSSGVPFWAGRVF